MIRFPALPVSFRLHLKLYAFPAWFLSLSVKLVLSLSGFHEIGAQMATYSGKGAPSNGSVYVCNLPPGTSEEMLAEYFCTIGVLKKDKRTGRPKIWLYRDKVTNEPKGDATVTYEDPHAALAAVEWFNNKDFHGATIGVLMAESKSKDENSYSSAINVPDPNLVNDFGGLEDGATDMNGGGGRGRGRGDASGKAWQQEGDWVCPNTSCSNVNFSFRGVCNRCGSARPAGASGGAAGSGRGKGRGSTELGSQNRAVGGLFGPNDWPCPMCGNINWAKRLKCNICNTNKPGHNEGGVRGGRGGGYKELDEEEIEEIKRRRREAEEDDGEMYDEFGNLKKKFRARTQQAEAGVSLPGVGRAGWEMEELGTSDRDRRERSKGRDNDERDRDRHRSRSRERARGRDRDRDYNYDRDREYGRERERERERDRDRGDRDRERSRYRY